MSPRYGRLGEQRAGGTLFGVGVGNVQSHAPATTGSDLHVCLRPRLPQPFPHDLHMPNKLWHGNGQDVLLDRFPGDGTLPHRREQILGTAKNILIRECRGGVDAVHHSVRSQAFEELEQEAALQDLGAQFTEQIVKHTPSQLCTSEHGRSIQLRHFCRHEDVTPCCLDCGVAGPGLELLRG